MCVSDISNEMGIEYISKVYSPKRNVTASQRLMMLLLKIKCLKRDNDNA